MCLVIFRLDFSALRSLLGRAASASGMRVLKLIRDPQDDTLHNSTCSSYCNKLGENSGVTYTSEGYGPIIHVVTPTPETDISPATFALETQLAITLNLLGALRTHHRDELPGVP